MWNRYNKKIRKMRIIKKFDKLLLLLGFLLVIAIFALAIVLYFKGGLCAVTP